MVDTRTTPTMSNPSKQSALTRSASTGVTSARSVEIALHRKWPDPCRKVNHKGALQLQHLRDWRGSCNSQHAQPAPGWIFMMASVNQEQGLLLGDLGADGNVCPVELGAGWSEELADDNSSADVWWAVETNPKS